MTSAHLIENLSSCILQRKSEIINWNTQWFKILDLEKFNFTKCLLQYQSFKEFHEKKTAIIESKANWLIF